MKEQLISFKTAKLAKEKGFDWIDDNTACSGYLHEGKPYQELIYSPTQSLLQKWLREKHNIDVYCVRVIDDAKTIAWESVIFKDKKYKLQKISYSYEKALEVGLVEALKIIEI